MVIDPTKLLPPGKEGTPEGRVDNPGVPEGNLTVKQYNSLNKNIFAIQRNLGAIADLIGGRNAQDAQEDKREIKQKRESADSLKKGTKENFIESSIKAGLVKPIQALKKKAMGPFGGFMKALETLFLGWLGIKGLDALEAWSEGDNDAFEKIKNDIIKGLAIAGGIALALNGGIGAITGVISGVLTSMLLNIPKILGLLSNPYLLLGAVAAGLGMKLYDILDRSGPDGTGRGSYEEYTQGVIDKVSDKGKDAALEEYRRRREKLLEKNPGLENNIIARTFSNVGSELNEIEQNIKSIEDGEFDKYTAESLSDAEKKVMNNVSAALGTLSGYQREHEIEQRKLDMMLRGGKLYGDLSAEDKLKYDALEDNVDDLHSRMTKSMKYIQNLRNGLDNDARSYLDARISRVDHDMFRNTGALRQGPPDPERLKGLDAIKQMLDMSLGKYTPPSPPTSSAPPASTVAPPVQQMPQSNQPTNITKPQVIPLNNTPYTLEPVSRAPFNVEGQITSVPNVVVMPIDDRGSEGEELNPSTPTATAYPSIVTSDPLNDHLGFTKITYG